MMKSRRELLLDGLRAAGVLTVAGLAGSGAILAEAQDDAAKAGKKGGKKGKKGGAPRGFRIGACDWTLGKRANPEALTLAKQLGLDGIQVDVGGPDKFPGQDPVVQAKYQELIKSTGMRISTLALGIFNSKAYFKEPAAQEWLSKSIDACGPLGARGILMAFFSNGDLTKDPKDIETTIAKLKEIAPKAEQARVKLLIESYLPAETLMMMIEKIGSPAVGVYYDVGNTFRRGYDNVKEIKLLGKNIGEFHAKDNNLYGKGQIDFPAIRKAMDEIGYRGWIHIEGDKFPNGMMKDMPTDAEYLRTIFPKQA